MARKTVFTRKDIIECAVRLIREKNLESLNARSLAAAMDSSTQPIFSNFGDMDSLRQAVLERSLEIYNEYVGNEVKSGKYSPLYKAYGMAYISFSKYEKNLFKLLFMRDRTKEENPVESSTSDNVIPIIVKATGMTEKQAWLFHLEMWTFTHGIAAMIATSYVDWSMELVSEAMTDAYQGLLHRFRNKGGSDEERH